LTLLQKGVLSRHLRLRAVQVRGMVAKMKIKIAWKKWECLKKWAKKFFTTETTERTEIFTRNFSVFSVRSVVKFLKSP
jgi:hypothetical protein